MEQARFYTAERLHAVRMALRLTPLEIACLELCEMFECDSTEFGTPAMRAQWSEIDIALTLLTLQRLQLVETLPRMFLTAQGREALARVRSSSAPPDLRRTE
jgi:hypothetical protein